MNFDTPILFIIFNKEIATKIVFSTIQRIQPKKLFIAADGPRSEIPGESEKCASVRKMVLDSINWDCEVQTLFRDANIGCGRGPSEAISWFFNHVNEGIILEDDCYPNESFFKFCADNLEKYRYNDRISIVSGNNFQQRQPMTINSDYYYSVFPSSNGWATWRRTWEGYDYFIKKWSTMKKDDLLQFLFIEKKYQLWWKERFDIIFKEQPDDMWDFQFHFHCMARKQLAIIPKANLVSNIGYGPDATHSVDPNNYFANVPLIDLDFPLKHPGSISRNYEADLFIQQKLFGEVEIVSIYKKLKRLIKEVIKYKR